jgi:hypothetical protein
MKLYQTAEYIKKMVNIVGGIVVVISLYFYVFPTIQSLLPKEGPPPPPPVKNFIPRIVFSADKSLTYDVSNVNLVYLGNPQTQWSSLATKSLPLYEYLLQSTEDIDYTPTAKDIALDIGYRDINQTDNAQLSNKYVWSKDGLFLEIDKVNKRIMQLPEGNSFSPFRELFTSGNFINTNTAINYARNLLTISRRFSSDELKEIVYETQFLRFEGDALKDTAATSAELSYVKSYRVLEDKKVVAKKYDFPQTYFYIASLRPEVEATFQNLRYPHFKINKIDYRRVFPEDTFDLQPLQDVVTFELKENRYVIADLKINNKDFGYLPSTENTISNITIDSYELGYYDNYDQVAQNDYVQPIYIFKGGVELANGERGRIVLYTPAVHPKYYNQPNTQ